MFAEECGVAYDFQVVGSLLALDSSDYGGNPALRVPTLVTPEGSAFGSLPSCRLIAAMRAAPLQMVWPEQAPALLVSNAMELTVQAMSTEVSLILVKAGGAESSHYASKLRSALLGMMAWLDQNLEDALRLLPTRDLSFLELSLFCLVDHLQFREVIPIDPYGQLREFRDSFARRPSAMATPFKFDT